ncbi:hypothetical protein BKA24_001654 [Microbacterium marinum]|uniref:Uncharacterized protein n=1 Tax=Microbacterium marinum TaxID=421115 RepID=A0A7W7BQK1_9MICO|nr:hypothetical protein [Microbacterium marinum]MBB4666945.1 hypothetical protein [Microbacterium marinum]
MNRYEAALLAFAAVLLIPALASGVFAGISLVGVLAAVAAVASICIRPARN